MALCLGDWGDRVLDAVSDVAVRITASLVNSFPSPVARPKPHVRLCQYENCAVVALAL